MAVFGLFTTCLLLSIQMYKADNGVRKSGPYKVLIEKFTPCDDEGTGEVVFGTKIQKTSDGRYMYNNQVYLGYPVDQNYKVHIELQVLGNGGYRPRFMQYTFKGCEEMWKYFEDIYKEFMEAAGGTIDHCPFPAGNYTVKNFDVNSQSVKNVPTMFYNRYRAVVTSTYKEKKVGCINIYVETVPK